MLRHRPIFWVAIAASLITGFYGLVTEQMVLFIPYGIINPLLLILVTSLSWLKPIKKDLDIIGALIIFLNIPGSVYLHKIGIQYDIFLHFFVSFLAFWSVYLILNLIVKPKKFARLIAVLITIFGGLAFEGVQKLSDVLFHTQLFFDVVQPIELDFMLDLIMDVLGAVMGAVYIKLTSSSDKHS